MESSGAIGPKRAAIAFILGTVVLDVLAFGLIAPVLPVLIRQFHGGDTAAAAATGSTRPSPRTNAAPDSTGNTPRTSST